MINAPDDKPVASQNKGKKSGKKEFKPPKKISARYLHNSGLAYLKRFPASSMHFRSVMMRKINKSCHYHKDQDPETCLKLLDDTVTEFQEMGLLDDNAYLKGMINSLRRRGLSAAQIYNKLQQKGYKRDSVAEALKKFDIETFQTEYNGDEKAALIFARKKKLGPFDVLKKRDFEKSLAMMARAGYSFDIAQKTLNMPLEDLPDDFKRFV